ncbi:MAG: serine/threonine protein kinase [Halioglobus sp.]|nr:serine/threonine protein kinase [Halioglobus sp.]
MALNRVVADTHVGPYRILRRINRGGQGSVYLGYDRRLGRRVAIKIYRLPSARTARRRLLHEAQLVASIQSPKVVQIHDVLESRGHVALVMEYVPGCDLEEFLAAVRPSLDSILTIALDIAGALAMARQQQIVHGDLKASNVLIADSGQVKLTDFGIAHRGAQGAAPGASQSAMSPEQYLGKPLDVRSDLFALGCLLYRMLSGAQPFMDGPRLDPRRLLEGEPQPLAERIGGDLFVPQPVIDLVGELLQKDPARRPRNTHRVRQVLRSARLEIPVAAAGSLLRDARPCFRPESPDDIPPQVPDDMGRHSSSRPIAPAGRWWQIRHRWTLLSWPARWAAVIVATALVSVPWVVAWQISATRVHFDAPVLQFRPEIELPRGLSPAWLVEQVKLALRDRLGPIHVTGPVGATPVSVLYSRAAEPAPIAPQEYLRLGVQCVPQFCVLRLVRERDGARRSQQAVLFSGMSLDDWADTVHSVTRAVYR